MIDLYKNREEKEIKEAIDNIQKIIGEILIDIQYLEYNLTTSIYSRSILKVFDTKNKIDYDTIIKNKDLSLKIYDKLKSSSLGEIIGLASEYEVFSHDKIAYKELQEILQKRNELVHSYFRDYDYYNKINNLLFLKSRLFELSDFKEREENFNKYLKELTVFYNNEVLKIKPCD